MRISDWSSDVCSSDLVGVLRQLAANLAQHRVGARAQAAGGEDEKVDPVRDQGQADDHLEGARPQQQPYAGRDQDPDRGCKDQFHPALPSGWLVPSAATTVAMRGRRSDWWAGTPNRNVAPPTTHPTP